MFSPSQGGSSPRSECVRAQKESVPYRGYGLMTAVREFSARVDAIRSHGLPRVENLNQIQIAHDHLCTTVKGMGLSELEAELRQSVWVVVGQDSEMDLGVDFAPIVRHFHDSAVRQAYLTREEATRVARSINDELTLVPRARHGLDGKAVVVEPTESQRRYRVGWENREVPLLRNKDMKLSTQFTKWEGCRQRRMQEAQVRQGLRVDGREFPKDSRAPAREDSCGGYGVGESAGWKDTNGTPYKDELEALLRAERTTAHANLPDWAFQLLVTHVRQKTAAYGVKGAKPTRLKGYLVNWDVNPDIPLLQSQARKKSPALQEIERRHLMREMSYDNLERAPPDELVEWASPVDLVPKPGEDPVLGSGGDGRLVCDYRYVNTALRAKAGAMTNSWDMVREAAEGAIKSLLDAYSGFSHIAFACSTAPPNYRN